MVMAGELGRHGDTQSDTALMPRDRKRHAAVHEHVHDTA